MNMSYQLEYGIKNIFVDEYNLTSFRSIGQNEELDFKISNKLQIYEDDKFVIVETEVIINTRADKIEICKLVTLIKFFVNNIEVLKDKKTKEIELPKEFAQSLNSVAISTSRGILFAYNQGTYLDKIIMPLVDTSSIKLEKEIINKSVK